MEDAISIVELIWLLSGLIYFLILVYLDLEYFSVHIHAKECHVILTQCLADSGDLFTGKKNNEDTD